MKGGIGSPSSGSLLMTPAPAVYMRRRASKTGANFFAVKGPRHISLERDCFNRSIIGEEKEKDKKKREVRVSLVVDLQ